MPVFAYRGLSSEGRPIAGVVDADSVRTARGKLRTMGIFPTDVNEEAAGRPKSIRDWMPSFGRKLAPAELSLLTRQLGTLLGAGVQLVDALGTLAEQASRSLTKKMLSQVRERVREGISLADALSAHPDIFSELYVSMVRAGEQAAALEIVLDRLADYSENQQEFVTRVKGALTYPMVLMIVGTGIMGFLVTYVVPQVATVFQQSRAALPLATQFLIALSDFLTGHWLLLLIMLVSIVAGISYGLSTPKGRRFYDTWVLRVPYLGPTITRTVCARFARTLSTLLSSGVQLLAALDAVKLVVTNGLIREAIENSREEIRGGHGMGQTLASSGLFPPLLIEMIRVGERSGELERLLERAADAYEKEVQASLSQMTTLLEPLMTIAMAAVIVFMMLAVLMPIFQLNQLMQ
ncbi:MAG TPA: type II secretion system inner membrane protein GspF [Isosphaeraceae bacterium]|nr:type II secretion system inner membrane protein GspF [Isosphaeraceae bacterium]